MITLLTSVQSGIRWNASDSGQNDVEFWDWFGSPQWGLVGEECCLFAVGKAGSVRSSDSTGGIKSSVRPTWLSTGKWHCYLLDCRFLRFGKFIYSKNKASFSKCQLKCLPYQVKISRFYNQRTTKIVTRCCYSAVNFSTEMHVFNKGYVNGRCAVEWVVVIIKVNSFKVLFL